MAESPVRVALLARPGIACERLQAALQQVGAEVVLVADPLGSDAGSVAAAAPGAVLVALEPAVEDVLDRYDQVLLDPAMTVIYDEAELAGKREGWDAARWTRHLAAKLAGNDDVLPPGAGIEAAQEAAPRTDTTLSFEPASVDLAPAAEESGDTGFSGIVPDGELSLDALEFDLSPAEFPAAAPAAAAPAEASEARPTFDFSALSLEEIPGDDTPPAAAPAPETEAAVARAPATAAEPGAVVVLAGIGGPDAVRQFLSALPENFPRPVLVRQRLDGGRHDRLVRQMQRATPLPVELAEAGATLAAGHVYILPDGLATEAEGDRMRFAAAADPVPVLAGLPASGSAILVLSGSDPATVGDVLAAGQAGTLVAGQSPEDCFDSAAPSAMIAGGAEAGAPADLAARVSARWPN